MRKGNSLEQVQPSEEIKPKKRRKFRMHKKVIFSWTAILSWVLTVTSLAVAIYFGIDSQKSQKELKVVQENLIDAQEEAKSASDSLRLIQEEGKRQMLEFYKMVDQILDTTTSYKTRRALNEMKKSIPKSYIGLVSDIELAADSMAKLKEQEARAEERMIEALTYTYPSLDTPISLGKTCFNKMDHWLLEVLAPKSCTLFYSQREGAELTVKNLAGIDKTGSMEVCIITKDGKYYYGLYRYPVKDTYCKLKLPPLSISDTCYVLVGLYLKSDLMKKNNYTFYCKVVVAIPLK
ncbi:hypothetical protein CEE36_05885 [candidate division TA06 bacterium B3_TA06]|uniref:Uncharacterized protein n=1 Tax=candidate division TA06 bacterium B3_TA06 TaxID=2012487 RepID=A0A532V734_UNCT6|nr:MAG: hypothetical protein CEE36_05885 [candidate division TA06 bacterium B3_TA06]